MKTHPENGHLNEVRGGLDIMKAICNIATVLKYITYIYTLGQSQLLSREY